MKESTYEMIERIQTSPQSIDIDRHEDIVMQLEDIKKKNGFTCIGSKANIHVISPGSKFETSSDTLDDPCCTSDKYILICACNAKLKIGSSESIRLEKGNAILMDGQEKQIIIQHEEEKDLNFLYITVITCMRQSILDDYMKCMFEMLSKVDVFNCSLKKFILCKDIKYLRQSIQSVDLINVHPIGKSYFDLVSHHFWRISEGKEVLFLRSCNEWSEKNHLIRNSYVCTGIALIPIWVENLIFETINYDGEISSFVLEVGQPFAFNTNFQYRFKNIDEDENNESHLAIFACYETIVTQNVESLSPSIFCPDKKL